MSTLGEILVGAVMSAIAGGIAGYVSSSLLTRKQNDRAATTEVYALQRAALTKFRQYIRRCANARDPGEEPNENGVLVGLTEVDEQHMRLVWEIEDEIRFAFRDPQLADDAALFLTKTLGVALQTNPGAPPDRGERQRILTAMWKKIEACETKLGHSVATPATTDALTKRGKSNG